MSIIKSEFALALNQVATERGISPDDVIQSIEAAILAAYRKEEATPEDEVDEGIKIKINRDTGEAHIFKDTKDITPPGFGRIAAQTAKQVILQKIREVEKSTVISHYQSQIGSIIKGRVIRYDNYNAFVDIGKIEAVLPKEEQIRNEKYAVNTSLVFYIKEIAPDRYENLRIVVSRSAPELIAELFKREVPEIGNSTVEVKKVVREPGERAKIAVHSTQTGVDPVGACVGQKGVRVHTVTNELGGDEKIDIIQWNADERLFLMAALSPAKISEVQIAESSSTGGKKAKVIVEEDQAPLAIGKNGINVNLASRLTGYEIDIVQIPSTKPKEVLKEEEVIEKTQEAEVSKEIKEPSEEEKKDAADTQQQAQAQPATQTDNSSTDEATDQEKAAS